MNNKVMNLAVLAITLAVGIVTAMVIVGSSGQAASDTAHGAVVRPDASTVAKTMSTTQAVELDTPKKKHYGCSYDK